MDNYSALIEIHVPDFKIVKDFYVDLLGFEVVWERPAEGHKGYLVIRRENNTLCFWGGNEEIKTHSYFQHFPDDTRPGYRLEIVIMTNEMHRLYDKFRDSDYLLKELKTKPWGLEDFRIKDPFGFYLRITTPHNILSNEFAVP